MNRRRAWFDKLAELVLDGGAPGLWGTLYDSLLADGMHWRTAFRIALRQAKLAIYLLDGVEQRAAARLLGVSERQAKYDAQHVRRAVVARRAGSAPVRRVPLVPEDVPLQRRRRRQ